MNWTFQLLDAQRHQVAVVAPVQEALARVLLHLALQEGQQVVAVDVDLEGLVAGLVALLELLDDVGLAGGRGQRRQHVGVREHLVGHGSRLDHAGPADRARHAPAALAVGVLLAAERRRAAIGPAHDLGAVVGRVHDDGVVGDAQLVELVEQLADVPVVLHHAIGIDAQPGLALRLLLQVREDVHAGRVPPDEERLAVRVGLLDELQARREELLVHRLHALPGQRTGVLDLLRAVRVGPAVQDAARAELLLELGILRIVRILRLLFRVQVVEVAEELVEAVRRRQELVAVAEMVLAELAGDVAERLQDVGDGRVFRLQAQIGAGQPDLGQAGADGRLTGDERGPTGGAALLAVPVGEHRAFLGDAIDVGRAISHDAVVVRADIEPADVVAPDDENVRLACWHIRVLSQPRRLYGVLESW